MLSWYLIPPPLKCPQIESFCFAGRNQLCHPQRTQIQPGDHHVSPMERQQTSVRTQFQQQRRRRVIRQSYASCARCRFITLAMPGAHKHTRSLRDQHYSLPPLFSSHFWWHNKWYDKHVCMSSGWQKRQQSCWLLTQCLLKTAKLNFCQKSLLCYELEFIANKNPIRFFRFTMVYLLCLFFGSLFEMEPYELFWFLIVLK